jgi:hypothetical protein
VKAKHFRPINVRAQQWAHAQPHDDVTRLVARWQSGLETRPGYAVRKLRLEFAASHSQAITNVEASGATP